MYIGNSKGPTVAFWLTVKVTVAFMLLPAGNDRVSMFHVKTPTALPLVKLSGAVDWRLRLVMFNVRVTVSPRCRVPSGRAEGLTVRLLSVIIPVTGMLNCVTA